MDNETFTRRRLFIVIIVVTVLIFIALLWFVATRLPWNRLGFEKPTSTFSLQLARNCTYPLTYWEAHPELYPTKVIIGGVVYRERELEALLSDDSQEVGQLIKTQLAVAFLNGLAGADQRSLESTMFDAYGWLILHPAGSPMTAAELRSGKQLITILQAYNLGLLGIAPCEIISGAAMTATAAGVIMEETSQTPSQTFTATGTETATPTATIPVGTIYTPSRTPIPSTPPPRNSTPTATRYSPPQPTKTPTTQAPTPTWTKVPDTPTYTPPPPPTSTFTPPPPPTAIFTPPSLPTSIY